jgi:hypothetical protein
VALANNTYSEREKEEEMDEVESILQSVEHSPTKCTRKISTDFGVPHKRNGELYVRAVCILFFYKWCNALKKETNLDQASTTWDTRAKRGTQKDFQRHAE